MFKRKLAILLSEKKSKNSNVTDSRKGGRAKQFQAAVGYLQVTCSPCNIFMQHIT
jgi:hypothetical protein